MTIKRKGARKIEDIPTEVLNLLNKGEIETVNLTEWLAVDHLELVQNCFPKLGVPADITSKIGEQIKLHKKPSAMNFIKLIGEQLFAFYKDKMELNVIFNKLQNHTSDTLRCYASYLVALDTSYSVEEKLEKVRKLVADNHFGVREVVWMALRSEIDTRLEKSIAFLTKWAESKDENIRRFTTEATRPRGVWCKHIEILKENPDLALPILEKLKSDPAKYVQDSVGNWLNDASKSQPQFVIDLCEKWKSESNSKSTAYITNKAMRTLRK